LRALPRGLSLSLVVMIAACGGGSGGGGDAAPPPPPPAVVPTTFAETSARLVDSMRHRFVVLTDDSHDLYTFARDRLGNNAAIARFHRDDVSATLAPAGRIRTDHVEAMAYVPQTNQLLVVASAPAWTLSVYSRNPSDGSLTLVQSLALEDSTGATVGPSDLAVAPDGNHVYLLSQSQAAYGILQRNSGGVWSATSLVVVNPSFFNAHPVFADAGRRLYTFVQQPQGHIEIYDRDLTTGTLALIGSYGAQALPSGDTPILDGTTRIDVSADGGVLYLVGPFGYSPSIAFNPIQLRLTVLRRDSTSGSLSFVETRDLDALNQAFSVTAGADPNVVHVVGYIDDHMYDPLDGPAAGRFYTFIRNGSDSLTLSQTYDAPEIKGDLGLIVSPISGEEFAWLRYDASAIRNFHTTGGEQITHADWIGYPGELPDFAGTFQVIAASGGNQVLVPSWSYKSVVSLAATATFELKSVVRTGADLGGEVALPMDYYAAKSPDDRHLYLYVDGPRILKLDIDTATASLASNEPPMDLTAGDPIVITDLTFSPDGQFGYLGVKFRFGNDLNDVTAGLLVLARSANGDLTVVQNADSGHGLYSTNLPGPPKCAVTHDGRFVYLANRNSREMQIYSRDSANGFVTLLGFVTDGDQSIGGLPMEGLMEASSLSISDDDQFMYVTADEIYTAVNFRGQPTNTTTVLVFRRDLASGGLTLLQMLARGTNDAAGQPVDEAGGSQSGALSKDGRLFAIVTRALRNTNHTIEENGQDVDVYRVDPQTGLLSHAQRITQGLAGAGASSIAFDDDGRLLVTNDIIGGVSVYRQQ